MTSNDGWIEWGGGAMPVEPQVWVEIRYRASGEYGDYARHFLWNHDGANDDIIAYRVIENDGREG